MDIVIRHEPTELKRARARIATARVRRDPEAQAAAQRDHTRQRALAIIKFGEELLASVEGADVP